jgi:hypothetical protein
MRQLDRLEVAVKNAVDSQKQWKQRVLLKHNEVESVKVSTTIIVLAVCNVLC